MSGEDYSKIEGILERLHAARNGCERIVHALTSLSEIELDSQTVSKIKVFSGTLQGVIHCAEKNLYKINPSVYASSRIPEVLVHRSGFVGRPRVVLNLVQVEFPVLGVSHGLELPTHSVYQEQLSGGALKGQVMT